jgi:hypothetical protein
MIQMKKSLKTWKKMRMIRIWIFKRRAKPLHRTTRNRLLANKF